MKYLLAGSSVNVGMQLVLMIMNFQDGDTFGGVLNLVCLLAWTLVTIICLNVMED